MLNEKSLQQLLTTPSQKLIDDIREIEGDIMVLGAGGKMGPSLCILAARAVRAAGISKRVIAVSRFGAPGSTRELEENGVEVIRADLQDNGALARLPDVPNIIYMAGRKFGTEGHEWETWGMNATLSAFVAERFRNSRIVVFSSANIYAISPAFRGGSCETDPVVPCGEYPMSCLARERAFEYAANKYGTRVFIYRLCFAIALNYGVLCDIATSIQSRQPIQLGNACLNYIWQGSANEYAIRALLHADSPAVKMNISGPEVVSVRYAAERIGRGLGIEPVVEGTEQPDAYLVNTMRCTETFGYPAVSAGQLIDMQIDWMKNNCGTLNKPTHFEARNGKY